MYKVGVCGHFGEKQKLLNGQTVKTKTLTEELEIAIGPESVQIVDTHGWVKNPIKLIVECYLLIKNSLNIIVLPAHNGVKVIVPLFLMLNILFHKKLHYVVIGGWLSNLLKEDRRLRNMIKKFDVVYVETDSMLKSLQHIGVENVVCLPNFKRLSILPENEIIYSMEEPYKLCTFSRVIKEKGIEDAINAVKEVNDKLGRTAYTLDIYGQVEGIYAERFEELKNNFPDYIKYKGVISFSESVDVLKEYFALLFPTYYEGEGFAGTILDAYASGIPIIATDWKYNTEVIDNYKTGILYSYKNPEKLVHILIQILTDTTVINSMKLKCLDQAKKYSPELIVKILINRLA